ncbi:hypothetical protein AJ79_04632 [Helicocarpus griseus UAMH5409]|uniref:Uncharacterized protein n=1 Tax=Helicocarpus griseus UAMH5409 TaxID=1447875 RepID=A0A2B7XSA3_9EURO|nr:hypothetical protein AJ79_04632 [Helicocarpus griseus UAMH5409]
MEDAVCPTVDELRAVYEKGYRTWLNLYMRATEDVRLPEFYFEPQTAFAFLENLPQFPVRPHATELCEPGKGTGCLKLTGCSTWATALWSGPCLTRPLKQILHLSASIPNPTRLALSSDVSDWSPYHGWFSGEDNHIPILILAWSYILSARWAELMPGKPNLVYTENQAPQWKEDDEPVNMKSVCVVDIGNVPNDAVRWWAAVLAPKAGWHAFSPSTSAAVKFLSPWSIAVDSDLSFALFRHNSPPILRSKPMSSESALNALLAYCTQHDVVDQSLAALSAALFLPCFFSKKKGIVLPRPIISLETEKPMRESCQVQEQIVVHLNKLLTMSCHTWGLRAVLSSVFYEPSIACNVVSPWLQSTFAMLDKVKNDRVLARMLMDRSPRLSFLWPGAIITGFHRNIFADSRLGLAPVDLHSAIWTGTLQSFIQHLIPPNPGADGSMSLADQCRLLYLLQDIHHQRWPLCPWVPFGRSRLEDTDLNVRAHAVCGGQHGLYHNGWKWLCGDDRAVIYLPEPHAFTAPPLAAVGDDEFIPQQFIEYDAFDPAAEDGNSSNSTRQIFTWFRGDGWPSHEEGILEHEWAKMEDEMGVSEMGWLLEEHARP